MYSLSYHKKELYYSAVGASGAVSGIVYSCIMLYPEMKLGLILIPIPIPGYIFGVAYLLYSIYGMKNRVGNIGHSAHLGGAIGGFACTLLLYPQIFQENILMISFLSLPILLHKEEPYCFNNIIEGPDWVNRIQNGAFMVGRK